MAKTFKTFCRNCSALCTMELSVEDNRIISVAADASSSPYGGYMCIKGRASASFHNGEGRLLTSLRRTDSGEQEALDVGQALDEVAERLRALLAEYGPRSIAVYYGTGAYRSVLGGQLQRAFLAAIGSPNQFSSMTIDQSAKWVTMGRMGVMASGKPALADVDLAVLVGNNPLVSHQTYPFSAGHSGAPGKAYMEAKARGTRIVVIDPRCSETARLADLLIQPLPGQDAVLFAALAHILLRDETYNHEFCARFVSQLDELREVLQPFTAEFAAQRADVPVQQIEQLAQWLGEARRPFVGSGSGPSMSAHSNLNDHMIEVVNALVGGYRRAGDIVANPGTLNPRRFVETAVPPTRSWERGVKCSSTDIGQLFGEFPTALLPQEIVTPGPNKIRALINFGGDPLMGLGDPEQALPAFKELDLLVSLDARINETGRRSDYVIAVSLPFERHDISSPGDSLYPTAFAQYAEPVLNRPAGVIDDWEFFWGIASRMRIPLTLKYWSYGRNFDDIKEGLPLDMERAPRAEDMLRYLCKDSRVSFDSLRANPGGVKPECAEQLVLAADNDEGGRLELCPVDVAQELRSLLPQASPPAGLYLISRRIMEAMNGAYRDSAITRRKYPVNWAYMNPQDMQQRGIEDGQQVKVASEFGQVLALARSEPGLRRGVVSMTHMFGKLANGDTAPAEARGSYTGQLTSLRSNLQPINFMPRFSGLAVEVSAC